MVDRGVLNYTLTHKSQSWLWWLAPDYGTTIGNTIYMPDKFFSMLEPDRTAWLRHEEVHVTQKINWLKYLTNREERKWYEYWAYKAQIDYLTAHGRRIDVDSWANIMSNGYGFLQWITFEEAITFLKQWVK